MHEKPFLLLSFACFRILFTSTELQLMLTMLLTHLFTSVQTPLHRIQKFRFKFFFYSSFLLSSHYEARILLQFAVECLKMLKNVISDAYCQ